MQIIKIEPEEAQVYFNFTANSLIGRMEEADSYFRIHSEIIKKTAKSVLTNLAQQVKLSDKVYRGLCFKSSNLIKVEPDHRTFISFSENPSVALHFADSSPNGFGRKVDLIKTPNGLMRLCDYTSMNLGNHGFIIEHSPDYFSEVLFHWLLFYILPYKQALSPEAVNRLISQKEVIIDPMNRSFNLIPYSKFKENT